MVRASVLLAVPWALTVAVFLVDVAGGGVPAIVARLVAATTLLATLVVAGWAWGRLWVRERWPWGPALAVLVGVAGVVAFLGLDHEVGMGYYADEGHYVARARRVVGGELIFGSFIYPHLTYYLGGLALWIADLFPAASDRALHLVFRFTDPAARDWMVLRVVTATLGAGTVVPVFYLARRVAGSLAAVVAGGLVLFAASYHAGYQVNTCDVPSAFFATLAMAVVGRLLERETTRDYLLAGVAAGLAAGAKYPAGVVAVAIVGVWIWHRVARRDWRWGLLWAGFASVATFLAVVPSFLVYPQAALLGQRGVLFGVRQYGKGGWTGVTPPSNAAWYGERLLQDFGPWVLVLAAVGVFGLAARSRRLAAGLLPFPVAYLVLVSTMNMVVVRNLFPVLPTLAVLLGAAASGVPALVARWRPRWRLAVAVAVVTVALAGPAWATGRQTLSLDRPSTREVMAAWIQENLPRGAGILKESYTPDLDPAWFRTAERRFAVRFGEERFDDPRYDYLLLASSAYRRFLKPENDTDYQSRWYRDVFARHRLVHEVRPAPMRRGPRLRLYRLAPDPARPPVSERTFAAPEAFLPDGGMAAGKVARYTRPGQFVVFQERLAAGSYRVRVEGAGPSGQVDGEIHLRAADDAAPQRVPLMAGGAEIEVPRAAMTYLYVYLPEGSRLRRVAVSRRGPE